MPRAIAILLKHRRRLTPGAPAKLWLFHGHWAVSFFKVDACRLLAACCSFWFMVVFFDQLVASIQP
ncbi:TPA: hypothetical protein ACQTZE_005461, partial [Pseudomonas aeruginosa]